MPVGDSLGELGRSLEQWREQESKKKKRKDTGLPVGFCQQC